ncbi:hypothetical protein [Halomarina rubra]|uniref:Uncharacterized protein n=1 Tax=Halomarina rubra TaxID=2071873 RepID=A0ABD6AYD9_9EURY|nr:hypothetical protein [Halomarina rubra]
MSSPSRWWVAVAIPTVPIALGAVVAQVGTHVVEVDPGALAVFLLFTLWPGYGLSPLLLGGLYKDASAVADADFDWSPSPVRWLGLGLLSVLGVVVGLFAAPALVGIAYLTRRHQRVA